MASISKGMWCVKIVAIICVAAVTMAFTGRPDVNALRVDYLNVGQGDAILITSPTGFQVLIDGGPDQAVLDQLRSAMSPSDRFIDLVVLSHPDADHLTGLIDVLTDYQVGRVFMPDVAKDTRLYKAWINRINEKHISLEMVVGARELSLPDGLKLVILHPGPQTYQAGEPANDASIVARLEYGQRTFLFTGDIEAEVERRLVDQWGTRLDADVLKVPHHGSETSSVPAFIDAVSPVVAVIQVAKANKYGHPSPVVLDRYARKRIAVWRNDLEGAIRLESDGRSVWKAPACRALANLIFPCKPEIVYTFSQEN